MKTKTLKSVIFAAEDDERTLHVIPYWTAKKNHNILQEKHKSQKETE